MPGFAEALGPGNWGLSDVVQGSVQTLASANTIAPQNRVTRLTGTTAVKTITPPNSYFIGPLYLYNTDSSVNTWDTTGNIALAGTMTRYTLFAFVFDPAAGKWYPSAVA